MPISGKVTFTKQVDMTKNASRIESANEDAQKARPTLMAAPSHLPFSAAPLRLHRLRPLRTNLPRSI